MCGAGSGFGGVEGNVLYRIQIPFFVGLRCVGGFLFRQHEQL